MKQKKKKKSGKTVDDTFTCKAIPKCFISHCPTDSISSKTKFKNLKKKIQLSMPIPFSRVFPSLICFVHILI